MAGSAGGEEDLTQRHRKGSSCQVLDPVIVVIYDNDQQLPRPHSRALDQPLAAT